MPMESKASPYRNGLYDLQRRHSASTSARAARSSAGLGCRLIPGGRYLDWHRQSVVLPDFIAPIRRKVERMRRSLPGGGGKQK
jgi:hypothetical protein